MVVRVNRDEVKHDVLIHLKSCFLPRCRPALIRKYRAQLVPTEEDLADEELATELVSDKRTTPTGLCEGFRQILVEVSASAGHSTLTPTCSLLELGLDSLAIARLSSRLSESFGVNLSPKVCESGVIGQSDASGHL